MVGDNKISIGLLGSDARAVGVRGQRAGDGLAITEEDAGGVVSSLQQPLVVGESHRTD